MGEPRDIEFSENAFIAAKEKKDDYILVCIYNLPNQPHRVGYREIPDPARIWEPIEKAKWNQEATVTSQQTVKYLIDKGAMSQKYVTYTVD